MKRRSVIFSLVFLCCAAQEYEITTVNLPEPGAITNTRIIGGSSTTIERFPYTVQVQHNSRLACGGSLITRRHVLSAAHCFFDVNGNAVSPSRYSIRVGTANLESGGRTHGVSMVVVHERYNSPLRDNDIAVMLLSSAVTLSAQVAVARIPAQGQEVPDNSTVTHVGWGRTNENVNQAASILQEVDIRTVGFQICFEQYAWLSTLRPQDPPYVITTNMLCSGLLGQGGADACQGDSGGPLLYQNIVVGVTSWGYGCGHYLFPGVNAKVSAYTNWINETVTRYNAGPPGASTSVLLIAVSLLSAIFASR